MMDPQKKADRRRRKKARTAVREKAWARKVSRRRAFPEIEFVNNGAPASLVDEVKAIISELRDSERLDMAIRKDLEALRTGQYTDSVMREDPSDQLSIRLGRIVYDQLTRTFQAIHRMAYDIEIHAGSLSPQKITFVFSALDRLSSRVFCSPKRNFIDFEGRTAIVAYHEHALTRIGERTVLDPDDYACRGQAFAIPFHCRYFELATLSDGKPAVKIWNFCDPSTFLRQTHLDLLGTKATARRTGNFPYIELDGHLCYYLVGYCPVERHEDYVLLKTLLIPGMDRTPEWKEYIRLRKLDNAGRTEFGKRVGRATWKGLYEHRDFDLLRELHAIVPQVKPISQDVFGYP